MTRKLFILLVILATSLTARAQWSKVDNHVNEGRPASALAEARKLLASARTPGERLQAMLCVGQLQEELTPDSFYATVRALDEWHSTASSSAERAVTAITIARLLEGNMWRSQHDGGTREERARDMRLWSRGDYRQAIDDYRRAAWSEPFDSLHEVKAREWVPYVELASEGRDVLSSRWWSEDLLHVILAEAPDSVWERARAFYATVGCSEPLIEDYIRRCRDSIDVCRDGMRIYNKEKRVAVLHNELMRLECPQLSTDGRQAFYPAHDYLFTLKVKNVGSCTMRTYSLDGEPRRWDAATIRGTGKAVGKAQVDTVGSRDQVPCSYRTPAQPGLYALVITPVATRETKKVEPLVMPMRVSPYQLLHLAQPDGASRFAVVDAISGQPLEGVNVRVVYNRDKVWTGRTGRDGRTGPWKAGKRTFGAQASIEGDVLPPLYVRQDEPYSPASGRREVHSIFTGRAIYRPGQAVQVSLVAYEAGARAAQVSRDKEIIFKWHAPQYNIVRIDTLRTDDMGTATATFALPADAEPGEWFLHSQHGSASFRVEEYKRPAFTVAMEAVDTPLVVRVAAMNLNGVPLRGARVTGRYRIEQPWWWRSYSRRFDPVGDAGADSSIDTLVTDVQGHALVTVPMPRVEARFAQLILNVDVTSTAGETHSQELRLPLRRDELAIQASVPRMIERGHITPWDVRLVDATGRQVRGEIRCFLRNDGGDVLTGCTLEEMMQRLPQLPSGRYDVRFVHGSISSEGRHAFTLFSIEDSMVPDTAHFYVTGDTLPCRLHVGSCLDSVMVFINAFDGQEAVWDEQLLLCNEARTLDLPIATHSDGVTVSMVFVKGEHAYSWSHTLANPKPDNRLCWHWETFRDRTVPGGKERWSGTLLRPDGTPAPANVMLTLYDAALDALVPHNWQLAFQPTWSTGYCMWSNVMRDGLCTCRATFALPLLREPGLVSHHFSTKYVTGQHFTNGVRMYKSAMLMASAASTAMVRGAGAAGAKECAVVEDCCDEAAEAKPQAAGPGGDVIARSDFSEAAVFSPMLRTDGNGRFTLDFTLPQSVTTWQLLGVAHTGDMMTASTRRQCVAQKEVMVQLGVPRLLRLGDEGSVTATVTNMTAQSMPATLVVNAATRQSFSLSLAANGDTTITVAVPAATLGDIVVTATVNAGNHSDGEQRAIPVIDSRAWVTRTLDLATTGNATATFTMPRLPKACEQSVTLQLNPAPVWTAVSALPSMMEPDEKDAISLANAYFATTLTHHLAVMHPRVQERRAFRLDSMMHAAGGWHILLERLQKEDGSFSWFPGGTGSQFITAEVVVELARLAQLTGRKSPLLSRAMEYLSREVDKEIAWMKRHNVKTVGSLPFYYLYASALVDSRARQADFLLPLVARGLTQYDLNTRALAAVILQHGKLRDEARRFIVSLDEHIVSTAGRGSYFDYPGGSFTSIDRKLLTLTTAIEAKTLLRDTLHLSGLRRNLLQQRRVQGWDNKLLATAAVSAVLGSPSPLWDGSVVVSLDNERHTIDCDTTISVATLPGRVEINPSLSGEGDAEVWGAIFIRSLLPRDSVKACGTGMALRREIPAVAHVGDRLVQRCVITVERDYEWVRLTVPRPAGLEPAGQLSGYHHQGGLSYYLSQHDDREDFFFERMPRGTYIIETQAFADRAGVYHSAPAAIECLYAPEFTAHTDAAVMKIDR